MSIIQYLFSTLQQSQHLFLIFRQANSQGHTIGTLK